MTGLNELDGVLKITTTTGTQLVYRIVREEGEETIVERTITTPEGSNTVETSITDIRVDGQQLIQAAKHLAYMNRAAIAT